MPFSPKTKVCLQSVPLRKKSVRLLFSHKDMDDKRMTVSECGQPNCSELHHAYVAYYSSKSSQRMQSLLNLSLWSTQHKHSTTYFKISQKVKRQEQSIVCLLPTLCIKTHGCIFNNYHLYFHLIYVKAPR